MSRFYLANAIPYVNAKPHIGHFLEFTLSDAIARYRRLRGDDVYFGLGTDENGQKMWQTAHDAGRDVMELATENAKYFEDLKEVIGISYDGFVRTTSAEHRKASQALWRKLKEADDLYVKKYKGLYCVGCESFKTGKDLIDGFCPNHSGKPLKEVEEENHFFKLRKYADQLRKLISSNTLRIIPEFRKNELLNFIDAGLEDVSFSRPKSALPWGIEVPGDEAHVMYVWCDALTNYLTHAGYPDHKPLKPWPTDLHVIGKDITRFHALIWQAMLMSAGLETSKAIFIHEFVTMNGQKMSKTLGNVVDPYEVMERYGERGSEILRFYLLSESIQGNDLDFTWERFHAVYESKLRNGIGNLTTRITALLRKIEATKPLPPGEEGMIVYDEKIKEDLKKDWTDYDQKMSNLELSHATEIATNVVTKTNVLLNEREPWKSHEKNGDKAWMDVWDARTLLVNAARMLDPFIPRVAYSVLNAFPKGSGGQSMVRVTVQSLPILFPPVEPHP